MIDDNIDFDEVWYDKDGNVDENGHYDAGNHFYLERPATKSAK